MAAKRKLKTKPLTERQAQMLQDDAIRHQVFLERLKAGLVRDMKTATAQADAAVVAILRTLESEQLSDLTRSQLESLLRRTRQAQSQILDGSIKELQAKLDETAQYSSEREATSLDRRWAAQRAGSTKVFTAPSTPSILAAVEARPLHSTGELLKPFISRLPASVIGRAEGAIRAGWAEGKTIGEVTRQLRGTKANNYKDGLGVKSQREAEAMVRTATQHVANTARSATWEANKDVVQGYIIVATLDAVTTAICRSLDKQRFKLGKGPLPPFHVNCRTTTIADLGPEFDFLDEGATRSSAKGYVPANLSYYDWLKTQDKEFVKEALGATRAKLFMDGGLSASEFAKLNLGRNFEPLNLEEMRRKDKAAFERAGL